MTDNPRRPPTSDQRSALKPFDRVAHVYDETRGLPEDAAREVGEGIARIVSEVAPGHPRALEVGVGTGRIAVPVAAAGVRVTGVDIAPKMLDVLRAKRGDVDAVLAESARPPFRAASFDAAIFVHILHLVPDAEAAVCAVLPLVRPGGLVLQGGDDRTPGLREEADLVIQRAVVEVCGTDIGNWDVHGRAMQTCERVLADAGASLRRVTLARWTGTARGRVMLERLARKDYSSSWMIPDEALPRVLELVTPRLDALYGGLDREIEFPRSFSVTVGRLPAAGA